jgi:hypothetical protein
MPSTRTPAPPSSFAHERVIAYKAPFDAA